VKWGEFKRQVDTEIARQMLILKSSYAPGDQDDVEIAYIDVGADLDDHLVVTVQDRFRYMDDERTQLLLEVL
jgi:hypothetical protein